MEGFLMATRQSCRRQISSISLYLREMAHYGFEQGYSKSKFLILMRIKYMLLLFVLCSSNKYRIVR